MTSKRSSAVLLCVHLLFYILRFNNYVYFSRRDDAVGRADAFGAVGCGIGSSHLRPCFIYHAAVLSHVQAVGRESAVFFSSHMGNKSTELPYYTVPCDCKGEGGHVIQHTITLHVNIYPQNA